MQKRFLKKRSPLSKKKLEQAGRPECEFRRRGCELSVAHLKIDAAPPTRVHSPRRSGSATDLPLLSASLRSGNAQVFMRPKKVILCIDDNEQSLSIRKFMLETRGYRVLTASSGREAIESFQNSGAIDLVLADLIMPEMDGAEVIRVLKELAPETPMILFSGKVKMYEKGTCADIFLPKGSYPPMDLLERIRIMLVKKRGPKKTLVHEFAGARTNSGNQIAAN